MGNMVTFRNFELRDVDFVYRVKNDQRVIDAIGHDYSVFSYEDAIQWVKGCMLNDVNYKYWAICTSDVFQNIVGWCGLSWMQSDDSSECTGQTRTLVIYDHKYRDTVTWYHTCIHILNFAFEELKLDSLSGDCLTTQPFHYQVLKSYPNIIYEEKSGVIERNGQSHDWVSFRLYKDDYDKMKSQGLFDYDYVLNCLKRQIKTSDDDFTSIDDFIYNFGLLLDSPDGVELTPETKFRDLDDWSSLLAVDLVAIAENGFHATFDMNELNKCDTIQELYDMVKRQSQLPK